MYRTKELKAWQSSKWVPAGYHDRNTRMDGDMADDATRVGSSEIIRGKSEKNGHAQIEKAGTPQHV